MASKPFGVMNLQTVFKMSLLNDQADFKNTDGRPLTEP